MTPAPRAGATDATSRDPVLEVRDLQVTFDAAGGRDVRAVRGLSYAVGRGEVLGIVGESGSGKSVSALAVMGLLPGSACARGSVVLNGRELLGMDDTQLSQVRGRSIAMVFQDPMSALTPVYTVGDQVAEAVRAHGAVPKEQARRRAIELLELVGIPDAKRRYEAFPHEFSGGMRQRVVIAIAIANGPDVILADEPTTALDVTVQAQILEVLRTAQRATGAAIVLITHDLGVVAGIADRVLVMYAGRGVEVGPVDAVYSSPRMPYTLGLLGAVPRLDAPDAPLVPIEGSPPSLAALPPGCPFSPRCPLVVDACRQIEPLLERLGPKGHAAACHRSPEIAARRLTPSDVFAVPPRKPPPVPAIRALQPIVLEVSDLSRHFPLVKGAILRRAIGTIRGVDGVSFDVRRGETLALVGESGSGKTTTLREVLELAAPPRGRIVVLGADTGGLGRDRRAALRRDLSVVFQDPLASLDPRMPVADILAEPLHASRWSRPDARARVRELLDLVGLEASHASRFPQELSGGQRQRVAIARALALEPRLVVLDEPVSALDVSIRAGVINLLDQLKSRLSLSYLLVAHDLSVVRHLADRVAVLHLGRIVEIGGGATVYGAPAHPYTQALLSAIPIPSPAKERARRRVVLSGDLPNPLDPPSGCRFRTRCPAFLRLNDDARRLCLAVDPPLDAVAADHEAACHYAERVAMD